jgi:hypothetical protein
MLFVDPYIDVEEKHWSMVITLAHMEKCWALERTCGTWLEEEHLA